MKFYIKANNLEILKNIDLLLPTNLSKSLKIIDKNSSYEYQINLQSALELQKHKSEIFYDDRTLDKLLKGVYFGNNYCEHLIPTKKRDFRS